MRYRRPLAALVCGCALLAAAATRADVSLPRIFGDNMVLQRDLPVRVWGTAAPEEEVTVRFAGQEQKTRAAADGRWEVALEPLPASAEPRDFVVAGKNAVTLKNVLVGEVWLCAGQSNMEYAVGRPAAGAPAATATDPVLAQEIATEKYPLIRLFRVAKQTRTPDLETDGWTEGAGDALAAFSAAGFSFGREIQQELGVPVGLIGSYWGGSRIEQWTPPGAYQATPAFAAATAAGNDFAIDGLKPGQYVPSMIAPLARSTLRGVLWYQGESNIIATNDGARYADKFDVFVAQWRTWQHHPRLPVITVQLAPFRYSGRRDANPHSVEELPKLWEAQALALRIPGIALVPTTDLDDDFGNIHPKGKRMLGQRLAHAALAEVYGKSGREGAGPLFAKLEIQDATAIVHFTHAAGLRARDGAALAEFELAGADGIFVPATAVVRGETVVVTSPQVSAPAAVRMGWRETAQPNLVNAADLPAHPFRSNGPDWRPGSTINQ